VVVVVVFVTNSVIQKAQISIVNEIIIACDIGLLEK